MNRRSFFTALALSIALSLGFAGSSLAQSLDQMRSGGKVGERYDGYAVARDASAESFVVQVNEKRRQVYIQAASSTGATVEQTGRVYFQENLPRLPSGTWILLEDGNWVRK